MDQEIQNENERKVTEIVLSDEMMLYLLIIPFFCVCMVCIIGLCIHKKLKNGQKEEKIEKMYSMTITGAKEYNSSPKYDQSGKDRRSGKKHIYAKYLPANNNLKLDISS